MQGKTLEEIASGENPTIDNVGKPLDVMQLNEDELRRLVLIKLAITACAGDWDGFLTQELYICHYQTHPIIHKEYTNY